MSVKFIKLSSCGCRSWFCDHCCCGKGLELRQRVQWVVDHCFTSMLFVTLTMNPKRFESPYDAYVAGAKRIRLFVARLKRRGLLHSGLWFRVLESHENGWPHFHLLIDASFVPFDVVWKSWNGTMRTEASKHNPEWGLVDIRGGDRYESREHAVNYLCAYLTKRPKSGWPKWILDREQRIRRYQASVRFWAELVAEHPEAASFDVDELERESQQRRRLPSNLTHGERCATCGGKTIAAVVTESVRADGEIRERRQFLGVFGDNIGEFCEQLHVDLEPGLRSVAFPWEEGVADFIRENCLWRALKKHRLDEKAKKFLEQERARAAPIVQRVLGEFGVNTGASGKRKPRGFVFAGVGV